jgi:hypothetical protein
MHINFSAEDEVFTPLIPFLEEPKRDPTFKQVDVYQNQYGTVTAKSTKLPNCIFNLNKALTEIKLSDIQNIRHYIKLDWKTILDTIVANSYPKVYLTVLFLKTVIHLSQVEMSQTDVLVLHALWDVGNSGLPGRTVQLADFYQSALLAEIEAKALQQSLANLEALKCIQVKTDHIMLTEQIVFERI